jgi:hypothetical protein
MASSFDASSATFRFSSLRALLGRWSTTPDSRCCTATRASWMFQIDRAPRIRQGMGKRDAMSASLTRDGLHSTYIHTNQ